MRSSKQYALVPQDPRLYQLILLSALLVCGVLFLDFPVTPVSFGIIALSALAAEGAARAITRTASRDYKSPLITVLSLSLLLRADMSSALSPWPLALAAVIAIASKYVLRVNGKHIFNPANIGIVTVLLLGAGWTTPGQWGPLALSGLGLAGIGMLVTHKAARLDVPLVFLTCYAGLLGGRALWLGDPLSIPLLNLQSGALLLFTFFMISDPKTTPDHRWGRVVFCGSVASLAYVLQYHFHNSDGLFYALAIGCFARPILEICARAWRHKPESRALL